jgi:LAO/AO transport system kinase
LQARQTRQQYTSAMNLLRHTSFWTPQVMTCSALNKVNIDAVWGMIIDYRQQAEAEGAFKRKRNQQNRDWMHQLVREMLRHRLESNPAVRSLLPSLEAQVERHEITPYAAANRVLELL